jgi:hypothetical protein
MSLNRFSNAILALNKNKKAARIILTALVI